MLERLDARIDWERRDRSAGMRVGLEPALDLMSRLGHPERCAPCVHVTGSKGKGSVSSLVAAGLTAAGLRVGRYGSPHVERRNERIVLDGEPVGDGELARVLEEVLAVRQVAEDEGTPGGEASWFDLMTAAGLLAFREAATDWNVLEVGLGGRLDSTNVVQGEVCVVTSIALEHTNVLGTTRRAIAGEKAGILKPGCTAISGVVGDGSEDDPSSVIAERARELGVPLILVPAAARGPVPARNRALAGAVLDELGRRGRTGSNGEPLSAELLTPEVLAGAVLPGRLEWGRLGGREVLLDGAHTPESMALALEEARGRGPVNVVLSLARDKDADGILKALAGRVDSLICTAVASGLHHSAVDLCDLALARALPAQAVSEPSEALARAVAKSRGVVLVTGSLYVVGAVRRALDPPQDPETTA